MVDSWAYVATGNSNDSDEVTHQLQAPGRLATRARGCTPLLVHHARKSPRDPDANGERLTDLIRNSSAFGAWFDAGLVLARANETGPTKIRPELRDLPAPEPFAIVVEDEIPAGPEAGVMPNGWLRLRVSDSRP